MSPGGRVGLAIEDRESAGARHPEVGPGPGCLGDSVGQARDLGDSDPENLAGAAVGRARDLGASDPETWGSPGSTIG